jgi:hypothetical protein
LKKKSLGSGVKIRVGWVTRTTHTFLFGLINVYKMSKGLNEVCIHLPNKLCQCMVRSSDTCTIVYIINWQTLSRDGGTTVFLWQTWHAVIGQIQHMIWKIKNQIKPIIVFLILFNHFYIVLYIDYVHDVVEVGLNCHMPFTMFTDRL